MFNPHIHQQQQQQQQQFHQHLRQLQQLFQQQPAPPAPQPPPGHHVAHHHHQPPRAIPVPPQAAPPPRMVNMCQATQTTIIAPNPMLQGAILMQQMQGNLRGFAMGGQQFRQFFAAGARGSLLGPVPMGVAIKSPMVGFPAVRTFHPHARYYNNTTGATSLGSSSFTTTNSSANITNDPDARQLDRKRNNDQIAAGSADSLAVITTGVKSETECATEGAEEPLQHSTEQPEEPIVKRPRTDESEELQDLSLEQMVTAEDNNRDIFYSVYNSNTSDSHPNDINMLEGKGSTAVSAPVELMGEHAEAHSDTSAPSPSSGPHDESLQGIAHQEETPKGKDDSLALQDTQEEDVESVVEGTNKFYCYLCSITCHNQQNFRSHMNSVSHQQRMMEIQHMSNACLVSLLPRVQESLQAAQKDGEKKTDVRHWCAICQSNFTCSIKDHRRTEEHKFARRMAISSCTVCKKHFRTSEVFAEHLQSQEHRLAVERLQDNEGDEVLAKLSEADTDGCSVEEVEGSDLEEEEESQRSDGDEENSEKQVKQDGWSPFSQVNLKDMSDDEEHDPSKVYGSSFLTPVAGFLCRLCNKFYHFESAALHSHCKSLKHFENLKRYRGLLGQKDEAAQSSSDSPLAERLQHVTETIIHSSDGDDDHSVSGLNSISDDTNLVSSFNTSEPVLTVTQPSTQTDTQQQEEQTDPAPGPDPHDTTCASATCSDSIDANARPLTEEKEDEAAEAEETAAEPPVGEEPVLEAAAAVKEEEEEAAVLPGKRTSAGKAKQTPRRRSARASRR